MAGGARLIFFIRHPAQREAAERIGQALVLEGLRSWNVPLATPESGLLDAQSMRAMETADAACVLVSAEAAGSEAVERELIVARQLGRRIAAIDMNRGDLGRLAVHLGGCSWISEAMAGQQLRDLTAPTGAGAAATPAPAKSLAVPIVTGVFAAIALLALAAILFLGWSNNPQTSGNSAQNVVAERKDGDRSSTPAALSQPTRPVAPAPTALQTQAGGRSQPSHGGTPSFDCARAETIVEVTTCRNAALGALERRMAERYWRARSNRSGLARQVLLDRQRLWLQDHESCAQSYDVRACIEMSLAQRIQELGRE